MPLYEIIPLEAVVATCCVLDLYTYCKGEGGKKPTSLTYSNGMTLLCLLLIFKASAKDGWVTDGGRYNFVANYGVLTGLLNLAYLCIFMTGFNWTKSHWLHSCAAVLGCDHCLRYWRYWCFVMCWHVWAVDVQPLSRETGQRQLRCLHRCPLRVHPLCHLAAVVPRSPFWSPVSTHFQLYSLPEGFLLVMHFRQLSFDLFRWAQL